MQLSSTQIQEQTIAIVDEFTEDWDLDIDDSVTLQTQLIEDLQFGSLDFVRLVVVIEDEFQQKIGFQNLLLQDGEYIDDLSILQLTEFIEHQLNSNSQQIVDSPIPKKKTNNLDIVKTHIDTEKMAKFSQAIETRINQLQTALPYKSISPNTVNKNPQAIFILSPPRSGSTLLRVMFAGHSQLFSPPELHLLSYQTLAQRKLALSDDTNGHLLKGAIRAVMELKKISAEEAQDFIEQYERQNLSTPEFYKILQQLLVNQTLVDKTPTYPSHIDILRQAEEIFERPLYIHLLRHPCGMISSYTEAKLEKILPIMKNIDLERTEIAELTWLISQKNICKFLKEIPNQRQIQVKFEDLVRIPEQSLSRLCRFMNIELESDMLEPYKEKKQRMTDGVTQVSEMSGDLKFHLRQGIESSAADAWKKSYSEEYLSQETVTMAQELGYDLNLIL